MEHDPQQTKILVKSERKNLYIIKRPGDENKQFYNGAGTKARVETGNRKHIFSAGQPKTIFMNKRIDNSLKELYKEFKKSIKT